MTAHPYTPKLWPGLAASDQEFWVDSVRVTAKVPDDVDSIQHSARMGPRDVGV
jgi:hypothetical protein